ncbi:MULTISPECIES: 2-hydroxyacid dehydrogenase [unclassified Pseudomonas]|uniref:2-hydroxyacid dehydrogenase n=1 Tax=unclassified Pseudomonas TaxID=196821 RepID=UPI00129E51DF|nr:MULTISPECIES: 2-hydroxyacid dehydrogenase [unclassified Pseudomonas]MDH4651566.1 2-hydroxyacid dehydrogenase [Pseudomonas sp. BN606]MRK20620.1 2-hydroxyacid dehydrogenase [Pseudomonas sp. JG-B]
MEPRILHVGPLTERFNQRLVSEQRVTQLWQQGDALAFLEGHGAEFDIVVTSARFGCSVAMLERLPNVRAICSFGVGYDAIAVDVARQRGIQVSSTPDVLNDCVADLAMGLLIDCSRRISASDRFVRAGSWPAGNFPLARKVSGKRLGIVGLGRIGKDVARRAGGFDMQVRYHNRRPDADSPFGFEPDLLALARWADFLVLTCPGGAATHHLISAQVLEALGPEGILVNVARGSVVDEQALVVALSEGRLGGAGLDVFEAEPRVPEVLFGLDNVVLAPHIGSGTEETRLQMEELVFANLQSFLDKGEMLTPVV